MLARRLPVDSLRVSRHKSSSVQQDSGCLCQRSGEPGRKNREKVFRSWWQETGFQGEATHLTFPVPACFSERHCNILHLGQAIICPCQEQVLAGLAVKRLFRFCLDWGGQQERKGLRSGTWQGENKARKGAKEKSNLCQGKPIEGHSDTESGEKPMDGWGLLEYDRSGRWWLKVG